ncbi:MAG TPA: ABC transporter substrate-binding protein [Thermodesulfobacteriota bacterium]|nr:ABC transporter substrate-binding protein [Thermodesulfobacteriota bacterium]
MDKTKKFKIWGACLLVILAGGIGQALGQEAMKLGVIAPLSGSGAGWGLALRAGAELASDDTNAQGGLEVAGKKYKIEVIPYDDKYQGQAGADAANRLIFMDKVKFIIGPMGSAAGLAAQEITEANKVLFVGNSFTTKFLGPKKLYSFRTTMTMAEFSLPMLKFMKEKYPNAKRMAILGPNDETGYEVSGFNLKAHQAVGHEIVFRDYFERGTVDFMPILNKIFAQKPDVLNLDGSNPGDCGLIVKQARQMGFKGFIIKVGGPGTPEMLKVAGKDFMEGFIYYSPINPDDPKTQEINKKYNAKFPPPMNGFTPQFYDGTLWLFEAIKKAGTITDTEKIRQTLEGLSFHGVYTGPMSWTGKEDYGIAHQVKFPFYIMVVKDGKEVVLGKGTP